MASGFQATGEGGKWVLLAWVLGSKIKMGLTLASVTATRHGCGWRGHGVGEWVSDSLYRLSISLSRLFISHFPFFYFVFSFIFCFLHLVLDC